MKNIELDTQSKIFRSACMIFLLNGFNGTTILKIATLAEVEVSIIDYYFRTKEKLYIKVVENILERILDKRVVFSKQEFIETTGFLYSEFLNNKNMFEKTVYNIYSDDFEDIIKKIRKWLNFADTEYSKFKYIME
jgi:AcrR family transcriptional regulator